MWDMKADFTATNPTLIGFDGSFVLEVSGETTVEEDQPPPERAEEGEVIGGVYFSRRF